MKKSKIYTKTGDSGETGLVSGNRISKSDARIDLYGELDDLNSRLGVICSHMAENLLFQGNISFLHHIQSVIFDLGSNLACEVDNRSKYNLPQITSGFITELEQEIDLLDNGLPELKNFILPGGSIISSFVHLGRTSARAVERKMIRYHEHTKEEIPQHGIVFLNRLSDYLFVLARYVNHCENVAEINWKPRK